MKKVFAFHLLNDYSGSPKVLKQLIEGWIKNGLEVHLVTSLQKEGFLSNIPQLNYHNNPYRFFNFIPLRLLSLVFSQFFLIYKMYKKIDKDSIVYVNTVLPFGAGILGKLKGCKTIYHIHETSMKPIIFKKFLFGIAKWSSSKTVSVSKFLADQEKLKNNNHVLHNAIDNQFLERALKFQKKTTAFKNVLILCSLKKYKGIFEFIQLASMNPEFEFTMVLNASMKDVKQFFNHPLPQNLLIFPTQKNVHPFYEKADIVLNLSHPDAWLETFGLTVIESHSYGIPVIVPPVGGIAEIVEDGITGFKISSKELPLLSATLNSLLKDAHLYKRMSKNASINIHQYSESKFIHKSLEIILN